MVAEARSPVASTRRVRAIERETRKHAGSEETHENEKVETTEKEGDPKR